MEHKNKEFFTPFRIGMGVIVSILLQAGTTIWYFAQQDAILRQHTEAIEKLESRTSVYINREQFNDLLGARDEKTANIEKTLQRIEGKLDKIIY